MANEQKLLDIDGLSHLWADLKTKFVSVLTGVTGVSYDGTNKKIQKTINGATTDVVTAATLKTDMELDNVGNFKAVSTVASQGLTTTEQQNARANIGAGTSNFSGDYNDLTNKPDISGVYRYKGSVSSVSNLPTHASDPAPVAGDVWNVTSTGKNYAYVEYDTQTQEDIWDDLGGEFAIDTISNAEIDAILAT
jgi:hypothetical protein